MLIFRLLQLHAVGASALSFSFIVCFNVCFSVCVVGFIQVDGEAAEQTAAG